MRRPPARIPSFGAAAMLVATAFAAAPAPAVAPPVTTAAAFAAAWADPTTTQIALAANLRLCRVPARASSTPIVVQGRGHVIAASCAGDMLRQERAGAVTLEDVTLRDARSAGDGFVGGAALAARNAPVRLRRSTVVANNGVVGALVAGSLDVRDSTIAENGIAQTNTGFGGGALWVRTDATITDSTLRGNAVYGSGAALLAGGRVLVTDSEFAGNTAKLGGAAAAARDIDVSDSQFRANTSYAGTGGTLSGESVRVDDSGFVANTNSLGDGGAIGATTVVVTDSRFEDNGGGLGRGGAIWAGNARVERSTFRRNTSAGGGAIAADAALAVATSSFVANSVEDIANVGGGAIHGASSASVSVLNSTFTDNIVPSFLDGAAIVADGPLRLMFSTIAGNPVQAADDANGVPAQAQIAANGPLSSQGTVVSGAGAGDDCHAASSASSGANYDDDGTCGFTGATDTSAGGDPQLGPLASNGGPTPTRLPVSTSPLVDAAGSVCPARDQRAVARPRGMACDIGAVER